MNECMFVCRYALLKLPQLPNLIHTHTHTHPNTHARAHTHTHTQTQTKTRTHTHTHKHKHTHAHTQARRASLPSTSTTCFACVLPFYYVCNLTHTHIHTPPLYIYHLLIRLSNNICNKIALCMIPIHFHKKNTHTHTHIYQAATPCNNTTLCIIP
jgi:hypothetical protein